MSQGYGPGAALPPLPPHLDPRAGGRGGHAHPHARTSVRRIGLAVMAAVSIFAIVAAGYAWFTYKKLDNHLQRIAFTPRTAQNQPDIDGKDQNLLVVGYDSREGLTNKEIRQLHVGRDASSSTDSMMIIHVPADGSKATLISLPRDAYVDIPGFSKNKLNAAFADGYNSLQGSATVEQRRTAGAALLTETISKLTGLTIDHFVLVSFGGFVAISDAIGGVEVNLCHAVDDSSAANQAAGLQGGSGLVLSAGKHSLQGAQALEFVRQRHFLPNGDLDRTARQRYFLTQSFRAVVSAGTLINPSRLNALVDAVDQSIWVDDSLSLTDLARQVATLDPNNIIGKAIPFQGFQNTDVGSVEIVDPAKVQRFVARLINPPAPTSSAPSSHAPSPGKHKAKKKSCIN